VQSVSLSANLVEQHCISLLQTKLDLYLVMDLLEKIFSKAALKVRATTLSPINRT
jgi:hypothetical protein